MEEYMNEKILLTSIGATAAVGTFLITTMHLGCGIAESAAGSVANGALIGVGAWGVKGIIDSARSFNKAADDCCRAIRDIPRPLRGYLKVSTPRNSLE
jgi:hypothetical protein